MKEAKNLFVCEGGGEGKEVFNLKRDGKQQKPRRRKPPETTRREQKGTTEERVKGEGKVLFREWKILWFPSVKKLQPKGVFSCLLLSFSAFLLSLRAFVYLILTKQLVYTALEKGEEELFESSVLCLKRFVENSKKKLFWCSQKKKKKNQNK